MNIFIVILIALIAILGIYFIYSGFKLRSGTTATNDDKKKGMKNILIGIFLIIGSGIALYVYSTFAKVTGNITKVIGTVKTGKNLIEKGRDIMNTGKRITTTGKNMIEKGRNFTDVISRQIDKDPTNDPDLIKELAELMKEIKE